ncbi:MAG: PQQ-dependent sugar dehydrogenase [Acidobacteriota bacterium]
MGKVLRINTDGPIPRDNPFVGRIGARPEIYAYGFRDDAGVAIHPRTGKLWATEHGPQGRVDHAARVRDVRRFWEKSRRPARRRASIRIPDATDVRIGRVEKRAKSFEISGEPGGNRTHNPQIKRNRRGVSAGCQGVAPRHFPQECQRSDTHSHTMDSPNCGQNCGQTC